MKPGANEIGQTSEAPKKKKNRRAIKPQNRLAASNVGSVDKKPDLVDKKPDANVKAYQLKSKGSRRSLRKRIKKELNILYPRTLSVSEIIESGLSDRLESSHSTMALDKKEKRKRKRLRKKKDIAPIEDEGMDRSPALLERKLLSRKKLLVLDLNGLLVSIVRDSDLYNTQKTYMHIGNMSIFKRPFCDDFLKFCFENFDIGIWSAKERYNVAGVIDYLMGEGKDKLLFCWDQTKCTDTGFNTRDKPLVLKELAKVWNREGSDLPSKIGDYSPSNTLLVDDSPYIALRNPPHTAIFPQPYRFDDESDNSLGPGGDLRVYLEGLAMADDVQQYVEQHPFGQPAITASDPCWYFLRYN